MKLRLIAVAEVNFIAGEHTNLDAEIARRKLKLEERDCVALISMTGRQVVFLRRPEKVELRPGVPHTLYVSTKFRLDGGDWHQNLLAFLRCCKQYGVDMTNLEDAILGHAERSGKVPSPAQQPASNPSLRRARSAG